MGAATTSHPRIGQIARELTSRGKTVFIEADGAQLRRRIHEFRPASNLFLVLPLHGAGAAHDLRAGDSGNFRATLESVRAARLSGFHLCAQTLVFADTAVDELLEMAALLETWGVDGWVVRRADSASIAEVPAEKVGAARSAIPNARWRSFSQQLERSLARPARSRSEAVAQGRGPREIAPREEGLGTL
jgi:MoaA/NifB/PqqE/SkfB family radical SAM enzyme